MILDTNALSAFADGDEALAAQLTTTLRLAVSAIALGEYRFGIKTSRKSRTYETWLARNLSGKEILAVDDDTAVHYADIRQELKQAGTPIPWHDIWIAAHARQHRMPVVSRDHHFDVVRGIRRIGW